MLNLSIWVLLSSGTLLQPVDAPLGAAFENRRLHIRVQGPAGWRLVQDGSSEDEPIEFWKEGEGGPRIQIASFPYPLSDGADIDEVQEELARALVERFPTLRVGQERRLVHQGHPAIEVTATLPVEDTYYHVIQRSLFARGRIFIITCASFEGSFIAELPVFRASLESVEILDEIFDFGVANPGAPLVTLRALGGFCFGLLLMGLLLRHVSATRLKRMTR
jgi:hypothetical protein